MENPVGFILAGVALAGSPGPSNLSLAATGAAYGFRRGLAFVAGIVAGLIAVMGITSSGVMGVLLALPGATPIVLGLSSLYFAYLAYRIATAPPVRDSDLRQAQATFGGGVFLSLVNPKGYAAFAALFSGFVLVKEQVALDAASKAVLLTGIITLASLAWLYAGAGLTRWFRDPVANRIINVAFALLLLASVALALLL